MDYEYLIGDTRPGQISNLARNEIVYVARRLLNRANHVRRLRNDQQTPRDQSTPIERREKKEADVSLNFEMYYRGQRIWFLNEFFQMCFSIEAINVLEETFIKFLLTLRDGNDNNRTINLENFLEPGVGQENYMYHLEQMLAHNWKFQKIKSKKLKPKNYLPSNMSDRHKEYESVHWYMTDYSSMTKSSDIVCFLFWVFSIPEFSKIELIKRYGVRIH